MGGAASVGISSAAEAASVEDLRAILESLPLANVERLRAALASGDQNSSVQKNSGGMVCVFMSSGEAVEGNFGVVNDVIELRRKVAEVLDLHPTCVSLLASDELLLDESTLDDIQEVTVVINVASRFHMIEKELLPHAHDPAWCQAEVEKLKKYQSGKLSTRVTTQKIKGLHQIAADYDALLFDQFGVLHDGCAPLPGALHCVEMLCNLQREASNSAKGKSTANLYVISNYSGTKCGGLERLCALGFPQDIFSDFICSGQLAADWIRSDTSGLRDKKALWIAHPSAFRAQWPDLPKVMADAQIALAASLGEADYIFCQGFASLFAGTDAEIDTRFAEFGCLGLNAAIEHGQDPTFDETEQKVLAPAMRQCLERNLPLVCANPDKFVVGPDGRLKLMQGLICAWYESQGGRVIWFGKPSTLTFTEGVREIVEKKRVLMIGDAFETDIQGAANAGIDSLLVVNSGIHFGKDLQEGWTSEDVEKLGEQQFGGLKPTYALERCVW